MTQPVYDTLLTARKKGQKQLAILVDPDGLSESDIRQKARCIEEIEASIVFVGGSFISDECLETTLSILKEETSIPVILFPGDIRQISPKADAVLFLSVISGRNPELLIGNQVIAAPYIRKMNLEAISTGYILVSGGAPTTVEYISQSRPIPANKPEIAAATAMAGEMLGMKTIYLDAGSGADSSISGELIRKVSRAIDIPLIVGGGISNLKDLHNTLNNGADIAVVGNAFDMDHTWLKNWKNELTAVRN
jgi:putative glycerol-1-phosphate prenyltransferase